MNFFGLQTLGFGLGSLGGILRAPVRILEAAFGILLDLSERGRMFLLGLREDIAGSQDFGLGIRSNLLNGHGRFLAGSSNAGGLGLGSCLGSFVCGIYLVYLGLQFLEIGRGCAKIEHL